MRHKIYACGEARQTTYFPPKNYIFSAHRASCPPGAWYKNCRRRDSQQVHGTNQFVIRRLRNRTAGKIGVGLHLLGDHRNRGYLFAAIGVAADGIPAVSIWALVNRASSKVGFTTTVFRVNACVCG